MFAKTRILAGGSLPRCFSLGSPAPERRTTRTSSKTQELLRAFLNVRGFQGSASTDVAGIGLALEARGMGDGT